MTYHFKIQTDESAGYFAECLELPDCATEGPTIEGLHDMMLS